MKLFKPTDKQWNRMVELSMGMPIPLADANPLNPFIYSREHGFLYVATGYHQAAMATLYAWSLGFDGYLDLRHQFNRLPYDAADRWLEKTPGAAFLSGVSRRIQVWDTSKMSPAERRKFSGARSTNPLLT